MNGLLIADFNIENLAAYLRKAKDQPIVDDLKVSYGRVSQILIDGSSEEWQPQPDFALVWTRPEATLEAFRRLLDGQEAQMEVLLDQVDRFVAQIISAAARTSIMFVPIWTIPPLHPGHGLLDLAPRGGVGRALMRANLRLLEGLDNQSNVFPLMASRWFELVGSTAYNPRLWYLGKIPFANNVFKNAAQDLRAAIRGIQGKVRKVIICDLDDTLWGGIVGDDGWQDLVLGGHDPVGEAFVDFQRELQALTRRGIILGLVSKNEETVALEAIRQHPEMVLKIKDFAGWRINWEDKAKNIVELMAHLNLGLESAVFIDDNPVERERVKGALPEVLVPDWPTDKKLYSHALLSLDCFDLPEVTHEDRHRATMYATDREREKLRVSVGSLDDWLEKLQVVVKVRPLCPEDLARATQLLNKTNQMNLSTRRLTETELLNWSYGPERAALTIRVTDKYGDLGLTGFLGLEAVDGRATICDFILSCRVLGRRVEETMLDVAVKWARHKGSHSVVAVYIPTLKNKPCLDFFVRSGFEQVLDRSFHWNVKQDYPRVPCVALEI